MAWKNSQSSLGQLFIQPNKAIEVFDAIDNLICWIDVECSGLIEMDTLIRDNRRYLYWSDYDKKANLQILSTIF